MARYDIGSGLAGAATGAATGAAFGTPGIALGGLAGGLLGLFGSKKKKPKKPSFNKISTHDEQQQKLYGDYMSALRGQGPFSNQFNFDEQGYNKNFDQSVAQPAYRNFQENIIPGITGQFRAGNLMNSSYAGQALSRAGRDVQQNLDTQRSANIFGGQQQSQMNRQNAINSVLGMQTFAREAPDKQSPNGIDQILGSLASQSGAWFADFLKDKRSSIAPPAKTPAPMVPSQSAAPNVPNPVG